MDELEANGARWPSRSSKSVATRVFAGGLGSTPRRFRHSTRKRPASPARARSWRACARRGHRECPERPRASQPVLASRGRVEGQDTGACRHSYFVYILSCSDGTLYVGSTSDIRKRERTHNEGHGAKYTAGRRPVRVVYSETHESRSAALKREAQIKRWSRAKKKALIDGDSKRLHTFAKRRR